MDPSRESANKKIFTQFSPPSPNKTDKFPLPVHTGPRPVNYQSHPGVSLPRGASLGGPTLAVWKLMDCCAAPVAWRWSMVGWCRPWNWNTHLTLLEKPKPKLIQDISSAKGGNEISRGLIFLFHVDLHASLVNFVSGIRDLWIDERRFQTYKSN